MPHNLWITLLGPQFHFLVTLPVVFPQTVTPCAPLWTAIWLTGRLGLQPHDIPLALFPRGSFLFISTVVFSLTGSGMSPGLLSEQCSITVTRVRMLWMCLRKAKTTCFRVGRGVLYKSWVFCSKNSAAGMSVSHCSLRTFPMRSCLCLPEAQQNGSLQVKRHEGSWHGIPFSMLWLLGKRR